MTDPFSNMNTDGFTVEFSRINWDFGFCEKEFEMIYQLNRFEMASPRQKHWQVDRRGKQGRELMWKQIQSKSLVSQTKSINSDCFLAFPKAVFKNSFFFPPQFWSKYRGLNFKVVGIWSLKNKKIVKDKRATNESKKIINYVSLLMFSFWENVPQTRWLRVQQQVWSRHPGGLSCLRDHSNNRPKR